MLASIRISIMRKSLTWWFYFGSPRSSDFIGVIKIIKSPSGLNQLRLWPVSSSFSLLNTRTLFKKAPSRLMAFCTTELQTFITHWMRSSRASLPSVNSSALGSNTGSFFLWQSKNLRTVCHSFCISTSSSNPINLSVKKTTSSRFTVKLLNGLYTCSNTLATVLMLRSSAVYLTLWLLFLLKFSHK